jgi:hypothetical protein
MNRWIAIIWSARSSVNIQYRMEAIKAYEKQALPLLKDISELYRIERQATDLGLSHERRGLFRHAKAKPVLKRLQRRFRGLEGGLPLFGKLREAVTYAPQGRLALGGYLQHRDVSGMPRPGATHRRRGSAGRVPTGVLEPTIVL